MEEELLRGERNILLEETIHTKVQEGKEIPISHENALAQATVLDPRQMAEGTVTTAIGTDTVHQADQLKAHHTDQMVREMIGAAHHRDLLDMIRGAHQTGEMTEVTGKEAANAQTTAKRQEPPR